MESILRSVINFTNFLSEYWVFILSIFLAIFTLARKMILKSKEIFEVLLNDDLSDDEKLKIIWDQIGTEILAYCAKSEKDWIEYSKAGTIKRAEVIAKIYEQHPELSLLMTKEEAENRIDELIDEALEEIREVIRKEQESKELETLND